MVGRLVEQQHVGRGDQRLRQRDALLRAARQRADLGVGRELQPLQRLGDALLPGPAVHRLDAGLDRVEIIVRIVRLVALAQRLHLGKADAHRVEHAGLGVEHRLLRHQREPQALLQLQRAVVGLLEPGDDLQQRGLAGAVAADQADALTGLEREAGVVEQGDVAIGQVGVGEGQQGHE
ncbi:hypothetical protein X551_02314 [Methylibium sp. T29]|nr:hypothetical protein X551_02314 [Methylibium sp. T29]EWS59658.1 hypothetical protein Y694_02513 [Methylibium sp. T29-B]